MPAAASLDDEDELLDEEAEDVEEDDEELEEDEDDDEEDNDEGVEDDDGDDDASIHLLLPREALRARRPRVAALDFHFNHLRV